VSSEIKSALDSAVRAFENAGARLQPGRPSDFSISELFSNWYTMVMALSFSLGPPEEQEKQRMELAARRNDPQASAALIDFASWQRHNFRRLAFRALWQEYFWSIDAFLMPVLPVPAFPHDHSEQARRTLPAPEGPLPYWRALSGYMSVANLTGCPATVAPAGKSANGLPVGIQTGSPSPKNPDRCPDPGDDVRHHLAAAFHVLREEVLAELGGQTCG